MLLEDGQIDESVRIMMSARKQSRKKNVASHIKNDMIKEAGSTDENKGCPKDGWRFGAYDDKHVKENVWKNQLKLLMRMEYLKNQPLYDWHRPEAEKLKKTSKQDPSVYAIRFIAENVQQRPLGCFFGNQFVILVWVIEKGDIYLPKEWMKSLERRKNEAEKNPSKVLPIEKILKERS